VRRATPTYNDYRKGDYRENQKPARVSLPGPKQREPRIRLLIAVAWSVPMSRSSTRARHILRCKTRHFISQEVNKHMDAAATDSCMRTVKTGTAEGSVRPVRLSCHRCGRNEDFSLSTLEPTSVMCFDAVPSSRLPPPASRQGAYIDGGPRRVVAAPIWLRSLCPSGLYSCVCARMYQESWVFRPVRGLCTDQQQYLWFAGNLKPMLTPHGSPRRAIDSPFPR